MRKQPSPQITLSLRSLLVIALVIVGVFFSLAWPLINGRAGPQFTPTDLPPSASPSFTSQPTDTPWPTPTQAPQIPGAEDPLDQGLLVVSMADHGYAHLFAYRPRDGSFTRLTDNPWDDITPSISPDGSRVAFSSKQNGYWNLYTLDLATAALTRLTDTPAYDANPTWSPDGHWLAYESYAGNNLDIYILSPDNPGQAPIRVTDDPGPDFSPAWSPQGRSIAFISARSGQDEVWIANLDSVESRFVNVSHEANVTHAHPAWSPDGTYLAWSADKDGIQSIYLWDSRQPDAPPRRLASGDWPLWSPHSDLLLTRLQQPNQTYLAAYQPGDGQLVMPPFLLPGALQGMDWRAASLPQTLTGSIASAASASPAPLWQALVTPLAEGPQGRVGLQPLVEVTAPSAMLSDEVNESFAALRQRLANDLGWDALSSLENAFVPLTAPLAPDMGDDWLYTGRAIAINTVPINAGWIVVVREDFGMQTYWRLYLKARYQDGSQGAPIPWRAWDLNARYGGNPQIYDQGGSLTAAPPVGYWIDFTALATQYGWERLPALLNWRSYYQGARFNEFVLTGGLDWRSAMLEIYPPEVLVTPSVPPPPSPTATRTPWWTRPRTATPTPTSTATATPRPTWTPLSPSP